MNPENDSPVSDKLPQVGQKVSGVVIGFHQGTTLIRLQSGQIGLLKIGHLSWENSLVTPQDLFRKGDRVEVIVLKASVSRKGIVFIHLGYRELTPDTRETLAQRYPINSRHTGKIVKFTMYGAFIQFSDSMVSYLHDSQISWRRGKTKASDVFKLGDTIEVVVLGVDMVKKQLELSYRLTQPNPWDSVQTEYPTGTRLTGCVTSAVIFGVFVRLPNGCSGMIHSSALPKMTSPKSFVIGDNIGVIIISMEPEHQRITLGLDPDFVPRHEEKHEQNC